MKKTKICAKGTVVFDISVIKFWTWRIWPVKFWFALWTGSNLVKGMEVCVSFGNKS